MTLDDPLSPLRSIHGYPAPIHWCAAGAAAPFQTLNPTSRVTQSQIRRLCARVPKPRVACSSHAGGITPQAWVCTIKRRPQVHLEEGRYVGSYA